MKLIFLYGPPAVGKLTIGREVAALTGWRLFHNHLTVDLVLSVYDFGTPGFVALREQIWCSVIRRAMMDELPGLIFTFNPESTVPQRFIDELFTELEIANAEPVIVELTASEAEIERRLSAPSRHVHKKLVDVDTYRKLRATGAFDTPVIPEPRLRLDTELIAPNQAAAQIAALV